MQLAVPSILANITIPLVGIVDVAILGHIADAAVIGGIAVGTMLFDLLYWNFGFLRVGTSGLTAQAFGRADREGEVKLLSQSVSTAVVAALAIWLISWLFVSLVLWCVPCSQEVAAFARRYFFVRIWAAPATLSLMALKGWFIGMQNTVAPMITDIVVNVVNMAVSYALAVGPAGPIGVAWGTLIAQYSGLLTAGMIVLIKYSDIIRGHMHFAKKEIFPDKRFFRLNANLFVRSLFFMVVYVGYTAIASKYGDEELAVSNIFMKLFMLFSFFVDGFAYAGEALTGKLGAQAGGGWCRSKEVDRVVRILFCWALGVGVVFMTVYYLCAGSMIGLLTSDASLQTAAAPFHIWLALMPLFSALAFMWDGVYIGAASGKHVRNCMAWAAGGFVAGYVCLSPFVGIHALYIGYLMHLLVRALYLSLAWPKMAQVISSNPES